MTTLYVEEWQQVRPDINGNVADVPHLQMGRTQLEYTSTSARTSFAFDEKTTFVVLYTTVDAMVLIGNNGVTADQNSIILPANTFRSFGIAGGDTHVAIIQKT